MQKRMQTKFIQYLSIIILSSLSCAQAEKTADSLWQVESGDTLYSVMRKMLPGKPITPESINKVVQQNPQAFKNGNASQLIVGTKLSFSADTPAAKPTKKQAVQVEPKTVSPPPAPAKAQAQAQANTETNPQPQIKPVAVTEKPVGRLISSIGNLNATDKQGRIRPLKLYSKIYKGDTLTTANRAHGQIRFIDGALLALRSNTELRINQYQYSTKQSNDAQSIFKLIKGGFRTITGAIGQLNKKNYRVVTDVATIGIRGTHYGLRLCNAQTCKVTDKNGKQQSIKEGLYGGVVDGAISIENKSGERIFGNDQYFHVADFNSTPKGLLKPPGVIFDGVELKAKRNKPNQAEKTADAAVNRKKSVVARQVKRQLGGNPFADQIAAEAGNVSVGLNQPVFNVGDDINSNPVGVPPVNNAEPTPQGTVMSFSFINSEVSPGGNPVVVEEVFDTSVTLVAGTMPDTTIVVSDEGGAVDVPIAAFQADPIEGDKSILLNNAQINAVGFDNAFQVLWGRWDGDFLVQDGTANEIPLGSLHFMLTNNATSLAQLQNLGPLGSSVIYSPVAGAGTPPTDIFGTIGNYVNADLFVDFLSQQIVNYNIATQHGPAIYMANSSAPLSFVDLFQGENISLQGTCNGGPCFSTTPLNGEATIIFVNGPSGPASGAATTFTLIGGDPLNSVGSSGGVLLAR